MREWEINRELLREPIIDIGAGKLPLNVPGLKVEVWDKEQGDATDMGGVPDRWYMTVYSHHVLEHITDPITALRNWGRILRPGGILYTTVPHRRFYEKRRILPSQFNPDHKTFWLPDRADPPNTFSLLDVARTALPTFDFVSMRVITDNYVESSPNIHPQGDFHLELILRKP